MQKHQAAPVVVRFRPTRAALLAALAGLVAVAFGLFAPLSAQAGDHSGNGRGGDKPWICHPVEGKGENGAGWNVINPNAHSSHINEQNGTGKHTRKDGRTDTYASADKQCGQGYPTPTKTHHPKPTKTCPTTSTTTSSTTTTTTTSSTTTSSSSTSSSSTSSSSSSTTPSTGATSSTTTTPEAPATQTTPPSVAPSQPSQAPAAPAEAATVAPAAQVPQQAAVVQNAVPQAATDGADLQPQGAGWTSGQPLLIGAGALLLLAAGLLSVRRSPTS